MLLDLAGSRYLLINVLEIFAGKQETKSLGKTFQKSTKYFVISQLLFNQFSKNFLEFSEMFFMAIG